MKFATILLLAALLLPLAACKVEVPEKLANALAEKISGKKTENPKQGSTGQAAPTVQSRTQSIVHDVVTVKAGGYHYYPVTVTSRMEDARVAGRFTASGGSGNDIVVFVVDADGFTNWSNNHQVSSYYSSGQVTTASVNVRLREPGTYYVVLSNAFSSVSSKEVRTDLDFRYNQ